MQHDRSPSGPAPILGVHPTNPRYLADPSGRAVLLTGSHTWLVLQDGGATFPPPRFDYDRWLRWLDTKGHRFFRMWCWEQARWVAHRPDDFWFDPVPYQRAPAGTSEDGLPAFDLTRFDERYFDRLRERVRAAGELGIYTAVMLFQGWSIEPKKWYLSAGRNPWLAHPLNRANNVNGIDGDPAHEDHGRLTHTLAIPEVLELHHAYVRHVIEAVGDLDNVLYEIVNEDVATEENSAWQDAMVTFIHQTDEARGRHHPVLRSVQWPAPASLEPLFRGPAEAIAPGSPAQHGTGFEDYRNDPPVADGRKVIISDTDHLWGIGGDAGWPWRAFMRGMNPIFMDPWEGDFVVHEPFDVAARDAMGVIRQLSDRFDVAEFTPRLDVSSTRYALANAEPDLILAFQPITEHFTVDLGGAARRWSVEWVHPTSGLGQQGGEVTGGLVRLVPPFRGGGVAVLILLPG
jgi:hypothetical protein